MLTEKQRKDYTTALRNYKKKYLVEKHMDLDESGTRLMINSFLKDVLDYIELDEIKTEYSIKGTYADYVIQLENTQHIIVEVKAIQINLTDKHIRQSIGYAADEGIDWVILTNGKQWQLYRVIFGKPLQHKLVFNYDLTDDADYKKAIIDFQYLTKKCVSKGLLEDMWSKYIATEPQNMCKFLIEDEIINAVRKKIKKDTGINFDPLEITSAVKEIIRTALEI